MGSMYPLDGLTLLYIWAPNYTLGDVITSKRTEEQALQIRTEIEKGTHNSTLDEWVRFNNPALKTSYKLENAGFPSKYVIVDVHHETVPH